MTLDTPDGLPPGQWITPDPQYAADSGYAAGSAAEPALWITDDPVPEAAALWAALLREHPRSGLWPLLLVTMRPSGPFASRYPEGIVRRQARRPWHAGELAPVPAAAVDELDAGEILARWWGEVTGQGGGQPHIAPPPLPFGSWPGLVPASERGADPDEFAAGLSASPGALARLTGRDDGVHIGLVPAVDGAAALAASGWMSRRGGTEEDAAVIRSWQDRFGARLCSVSTDTLILSVAWPPEPRHHLRIAAEHLAYETSEALHETVRSLTFEEYAAGLSQSHIWRFWWD